MIRPKRDRFVQAQERFIQPFELEEGISAIGECVGVRRMKRDCTVEACKRFTRTLQLLKRNPAIVEGIGVVAIDLNRGVNLPNSRRMIASLRSDDAQEMETAEMIGLPFKNLPIELLGLVQMAPLVVHEGFIVGSLYMDRLGR